MKDRPLNESAGRETIENLDSEKGKQKRNRDQRQKKNRNKKKEKWINVCPMARVFFCFYLMTTQRTAKITIKMRHGKKWRKIGNAYRAQTNVSCTKWIVTQNQRKPTQMKITQFPLFWTIQHIKHVKQRPTSNYWHISAMHSHLEFILFAFDYFHLEHCNGFLV